MKSRKCELNEYNKYLLNKQTVSPRIIAHIESLNTDNVPNYAFHKIMINNWPANLDVLFDTVSHYFTSSLIPVSPSVQDEITTFYTSNLNFILKVIKLDFKFLYERIIVNIDVIYNDKTSVDFFNKYETIKDVLSGVVSRRFENQELDLSDFCNDAEFLTKKINFYKLNLLSSFKIIMLRIGKETRSLNLSNNNLREPPSSILNFFIRADFNSINLGYNNIKSLNQMFAPDLYCYKNKLEKLWLEGNPLCDELDPWAYVKALRLKFPKLIELDGVKLNPNTILLPLVKNYLVTPDHCTKAFVEEFLSNYFLCYDHPSRLKLASFYRNCSKLSITTNSLAAKELRKPYHEQAIRRDVYSKQKYAGTRAIYKALKQCPNSITDRNSLTVDLLVHNDHFIVLVVEGMHIEPNHEENKFTFRRTFAMKLKRKQKTAMYYIVHEMFFLKYVGQCKSNIVISPLPGHPIALKDPDPEEIQALVTIFMELSGLKAPIAEKRLKDRYWDIRRALMVLTTDLRTNQVSSDDFVEVDTDASDSCSLIDMVD